MPTHYLYKIYGTYAAVWLLTILEAYIKRISSHICGYFYRKRKKARILFIYNEILKRRRSYVRYMKRKVKKLARERRLQNNVNVCIALRIRFPVILDFLRIFPMARRKCLICSEPEPFLKSKAKRTFVECPTPYCPAIYCDECWFDVGQICYVCTEPSSENTEDSTDDSDFQSD